MAGRAEFDAWIAAYERAWRTPGTEPLAELFGADATYRMSPYEDSARGLGAIAALWEREREGPDEGFEMTHEIVAVEGDVGVVRVEISYDRGTEYRDLWLIRLDADGRCVEFEEWPFWPERRITADEDR
ncbi:MAG TPA: nuclear transport factor 2 family protein [Solirubrobacterales bacterium]